MIAARVIIAPDDVEADFGIWEFLALPRIGESVSVWDLETDRPVGGRVVAIYHHPKGPHSVHSAAHITINIIKPR